MIINTANSYDIDLRYSAGYAKGIPDHNTNNCIFQNIMTGGYRFQDAGSESNCIGGENAVVKVKDDRLKVKERSNDVKSKVSVSRYAEDVEDIEIIPLDKFIKKELKELL